MEVSLQRIGVVIFFEIGYLSVFAQIFGTQVFFLDVTLNDILEVCSISFGTHNDSSLFYLNRIIIKGSWFLILSNFS
jgi:hypothetical protein